MVALVDEIEATYGVDNKGVDEVTMCLTNLRILRVSYTLQRRHRLSTTFVLSNLKSAEDEENSSTYVSAKATPANLKRWQAHQLLQLVYSVIKKHVRIATIELEALDLQSIVDTNELFDDARFQIATSSPRKVAL